MAWQVIQYARVLPCYLNRQLITLLTTLGVRDEHIEHLYMQMMEWVNTVRWVCRRKALAWAGR